MTLAEHEKWMAFERGTSIGQRGSEGGTIILDELHADGARITLERIQKRRVFRRPSVTFAITCGVYGWMVHTRFFSEGSDATSAFHEMKIGLEDIVARLPLENAPDLEERMAQVPAYLHDFIAKFP